MVRHNIGISRKAAVPDNLIFYSLLRFWPRESTDLYRMNNVVSFLFTLLCVLIWLSGSEAFSAGNFNNQADACLRLHPIGHGVAGQTTDPEYVIEVSQDYYEPGIPLQGRQIVLFVPSLSHSFQLSWLTLIISFLLSSLSPFWLHLFLPFLSLFLFILFVVVVVVVVVVLSCIGK